MGLIGAGVVGATSVIGIAATVKGIYNMLSSKKEEPAIVQPYYPQESYYQQEYRR